MKKLSLLVYLFAACVFTLFGQTIVITGTVTSSVVGEGIIPGLTVQVKGTTIGTVTDKNGNYTLNVPLNATTLIFSYVGMKKLEREIGGKSVIDVIMEPDVQALDEVVVTSGYDLKRTTRSTSFLNQVIPGNKLNEVRHIDINNALAGKVSGIQFLGQSGVKLDYTAYSRLRGNSGFGTGTSVIYVIDGTIIQNAADINLDDIDNVSVLSGPAAAAILGSQGASGAVIITTKKAQAGGRESMKIELNSGLQVSSVYILPKYQNEYAGGTESEMVKYTYKVTDPEEWKPLDGKYYPDYSNDSSWGPRMDGQEYIPWYAWYPGTKYTGKTANLIPQPDNIREFYNSGTMFNNSASFDKAGDRYNIRTVLGNISINGNIPGTSSNKTNFALKTSYKITGKLTVAANINFFTTYNSGDFYDGFVNQSTGSFNQWFHRDLDMNILRELQGLKTPTGILASWNHDNPPVYNADNPLLFYGANYWFNFFDYYNFSRKYSRSDHLFGDASLSYKIIDGMDFKITYRRQELNSWMEQKVFCDLFESQNQAWWLQGNGYYYSSTGYSNNENFESLLSFKRKFGNISINANAGSDFFRRIVKYNSAATVTGLYIRNLFSISNSIDQPTISNERSEEKYRALFVRGDVGFRNLIFGEFTLRNDWFSTLPPDNNSVFSKSFGASFVFSDILKFKWLNYAKLRASWGEIPTSIGPYIYPGSLYTVGQYQWNGNLIMTTPDQLVDPNIKGDVKTQKEIGLELRFLNNRAGITATYWDGTEKNIPYPVSISGYSGYSSKYLNTGKISKQGVDIALNFTPLNMTNLTWDLSVIYSHLIKNEVVWITEGIDRFVVPVQKYWQGRTPDLVHAVGHTWGELFGSGMKMYNGKPELDPKGNYVTDPEKYFGSILPKVTGGIQNSFKILKNITLIANIDYQYGGKYFSTSDFWGTYAGLTSRTSGLNDKGNPIRDPVDKGGGVHVSGVDAATHDDVDYYLDALTYFQNFDNLKIFDPFVHDLTYIKFRELSVGYDFPMGKMAKLNKYIQRVNISVVAQNFWLIFAKNYDFDPSEISNISGEEGQFPGIRSFGANIRINF